MTAPQHFSHAVIGGVEYRPDEDGHVEVNDALHVPKLHRLGLRPFDPYAPGASAVVGVTEMASDPDMQDRFNDLVSENAALASRASFLEADNARLSSELTAAQDALRAATAGPGTTGTDTADAASRDTSSSAGGATPITEADLGAMNRDQLVAWINENGGSIAANVSTEAALTAAKDLLAEKSKSE